MICILVVLLLWMVGLLHRSSTWINLPTAFVIWAVLTGKVLTHGKVVKAVGMERR